MLILFGHQNYVMAETKQEKVKRLEKEVQQLKSFMEVMELHRDEIIMVPNKTSDNKPKYVEVSWINEKGPYAKTGLQKKDIITNVDGTSIDMPPNAILIFDLPKKPGPHKILIMRQGKEKSLNFNY